MCVAFIPFHIALLAEYIREPEHRTTAVAVYSSTPAVTAIFFTLLWLYVARDYRLVDRNLDPALLRAMTRRYVRGMVLYVVAFALTFVSIVLTLALIVGLTLLFVLPNPGAVTKNQKLPSRTIDPPRSQAKLSASSSNPS